MRKQTGMSALKLILIIALGILMAGFIGCVGSLVFTGAVVKGISDKFNETQQPQIATKSLLNVKTPQQSQAEENQRRIIENQQKMDKFIAEQKQIQLNRPMEQPTQGYVEMGGKRIAIPKQELTRQDVIDYRKKTGNY